MGREWAGGLGWIYGREAQGADEVREEPRKPAVLRAVGRQRHRVGATEERRTWTYLVPVRGDAEDDPAAVCLITFMNTAGSHESVNRVGDGSGAELSEFARARGVTGTGVRPRISGSVREVGRVEPWSAANDCPGARWPAPETLLRHRCDQFVAIPGVGRGPILGPSLILRAFGSPASDCQPAVLDDEASPRTTRGHRTGRRDVCVDERCRHGFDLGPGSRWTNGAARLASSTARVSPRRCVACGSGEAERDLEHVAVAEGRHRSRIRRCRARCSPRPRASRQGGDVGRGDGRQEMSASPGARQSFA